MKGSQNEHFFAEINTDVTLLKLQYLIKTLFK